MAPDLIDGRGKDRRIRGCGQQQCLVCLTQPQVAPPESSRLTRRFVSFVVAVCTRSVIATDRLGWSTRSFPCAQDALLMLFSW
ncbi:hypothetical protein RSOLAG1IB_02267 [Rhizoctonia solani AG-1 IB]|uniref:Uncharacterized protein n=1 Tax=Thanatephorus cucumeris (strain AG1-IB / isolate 7/3/14) TaxID=1108050 RepID=A0A0B7FIR4_THACB|nr:hypothetical protein RSOLAG1IB_02267 [Rhizoctonia solani AG-1 IB]